MLEINKIYCGDSFELIEQIEDNSIDMILEDMPYNITACKWDVKIDLEKYWESRKRIIKDNGVIVLTASQPFTSMLVMSNLDMFKYEWIWDKIKPSSFLTAKIEPLRKHESILVFGYKKILYNPQKTKGRMRNKTPIRKGKDGVFGIYKGGEKVNMNDDYYPKSIIEVSNSLQKGKEHPTQKPLELFKYLISTYTNENDLVFDGFLGSGTTAISCKELNRRYIGIEMDKKYFEISIDRVDKVRVINREYF